MELVHRDAGEDRERDAGTDSRHLDQLAKQAPLALGAEAEQHMLWSPEAARWGATALAVVGLVTIAGAIARAAVETDLRGLAGALPAATGGAVWVAASSLTPQGVQGAIALAVARPVAAALLVLCAGALGVNLLSFGITILVARIPRYFGMAWLGAQVGEHSLDYLRAHMWELAAFAAGLFVFLYLLIRLRDRLNPATPEAS